MLYFKARGAILWAEHGMTVLLQADLFDGNIVTERVYLCYAATLYHQSFCQDFSL